MKRQKIEEVIKDLEKFRERWLEWTQYDPIERYATALQYAIDHLNTEQPSQECAECKGDGQKKVEGVWCDCPNCDGSGKLCEK